MAGLRPGWHTSRPLSQTGVVASIDQTLSYHMARLPFAVPTTAVLRASPKKVWSHYFVTFPLSLDDADPSVDYYQRNYLQPSGESNKFLAQGGYLRERPLPRPPVGTGYADLDLKTEIRRAISMGIDGFVVDILGSSGTNWTRVLGLLTAAAAVDPNFKIVLMPDMSAEFLASPGNVITVIQTLAQYSAAYRLPDGRLVVAPFEAERQTPSWWTSTLATLASSGVQVAFWPCFLNAGDPGNITNYTSISYGMGDWGGRTPSVTPTDRVAQMHALGLKWMSPVSPQDSRPKDTTFSECVNSLSYRNWWNSAISRNTDWVQVITWNDYSEATEVSPSTGSGWAYFDLTAYYTAWLKTGTAPAITSDAIYYFHRVQSTTVPLTVQTVVPTCMAGTPSNLIEMVGFLTAPATLEITIGTNVYTQAYGAGLQTLTCPLAPGIPRFRIIRNGHVVLSLTSAFSIVATAAYQDYLYRAGSISTSGT